MESELENFRATAQLLPSKKRSRGSTPPKSFKAWTFLCAHISGCIALSLALVFWVNGYNAIDTASPRYFGNKLRLRVSDVTTLVSAALNIIKALLASWSGMLWWRCAYMLTYNGMNDSRVLFTIRHNCHHGSNGIPKTQRMAELGHCCGAAMYTSSVYHRTYDF